MSQDNTLADIEAYIRSAVAEETSAQVDEVDVEQTFHELGLDSINAIFVLEKVEQRFQIDLSPILFWDYPTIRSFAEYMQSQISAE